MILQWGVRRLIRALFPKAKGAPHGDPALIEGMGDHLAACFGTEPVVFHEVVSSHVHIDIYVVPPGNDRPFFTLVSCGMSERAMDLPADVTTAPRHVELVMLLPPDWHLEQGDFSEERWYWPVRHIKMLARAPHAWNTWFGLGHTVQFDDALTPFTDEARFCAYMFAPEPFGEGFSPLCLGDGREISFLMAVPIFAEELAHARDHGTESLAQRFDEADVDLVIDPHRGNVCQAS